MAKTDISVAQERAQEYLDLARAFSPDAPGFASTFGHSISKDYPLYETEYGNAHIFQQSQELADIAGFYRAFGLDLATDAHERADHLGVELEFMHFMVTKEAHARGRGEAEKADLCREAQEMFLKGHLVRWIPAFASRLRQKAPDSPFVAPAARLAELLRAECEHFGIQLANVPSVDLRGPSFQPEGDCFSCGAADLNETFFNKPGGAA